MNNARHIFIFKYRTLESGINEDPVRLSHLREISQQICDAAAWTLATIPKDAREHNRNHMLINRRPTVRTLQRSSRERRATTVTSAVVCKVLFICGATRFPEILRVWDAGESLFDERGGNVLWCRDGKSEVHWGFFFRVRKISPCFQVISESNVECPLPHKITRKRKKLSQQGCWSCQTSSVAKTHAHRKST